MARHRTGSASQSAVTARVSRPPKGKVGTAPRPKRSCEESGQRRPGFTTRQCTPSCHEAKGPICECVCGGEFHGASFRTGGLDGVLAKAPEELTKLLSGEARQLGLPI